MAPAAACVAQSSTSFSVVPTKNNLTTLNGWTPQNIYAVDINNDGIPDLIQDEAQGSSGGTVGVFGVSIANGDGTFRPAIATKYPPGVQLAPMTFGDFNGDRKVDIAIPLVGKNTIAIYLGNGDGTFVSPWYFNIPLSAGQTFGASPLVAADFNRDGKLDLAVVGANMTNTTVYVLPGAGTGVFSTAQPILTVPTANNPSFDAVQSMAIGDFDADNNADIALTATTGSSSGGYASSTIHVLYGEGNFAFIDTTPLVNTAPVNIGAGDLNSDGHTDVYGLDTNTYHLDILYGESNRLFAVYTTPVPPTAYSGALFMPALAMADFNDDGRMDLVTTVADGQTAKLYMVFFLASPSLGQFTTQTWNILSYNFVTYPTMPVVGDFNRDTKPDFALVNYISPGDSAIYTGVNQTTGLLWSNCNYPATGRGIMLCSPGGVTTSKANFSATAHSYGQLRKIELWLDGTKLGEQHHTWGGNAYFNLNAAVSPGTHKGTIYAVDVDHTLQRFDFPITNAPSSCSAPASAGVHICSPANGSTTSANPVLVQATATITGTLARMEVWVDSTKNYTETASTQLDAFLYMKPGSHTVTVFAVNTSGTVWRQAVSVTVP